MYDLQVDIVPDHVDEARHGHVMDRMDDRTEVVVWRMERVPPGFHI